MALPVLGHEDPGQVGVAVEGDAEHVEHLALHALGAGVDLEEGGHDGIGLGNLDPDAQALPGVVRHEDHDHLEAFRLDAGGYVGMGVGEVVDARDVEALDPPLVAQGSNQGDELLASGVDHLLTAHAHDRSAVKQLRFGRGFRRHRLIGGGGGLGHG